MLSDGSDDFVSTTGTVMEMFRFKEIGFDGGGTSGEVEFVDSDGDLRMSSCVESNKDFSSSNSSSYGI